MSIGDLELGLHLEHISDFLNRGRIKLAEHGLHQEGQLKIWAVPEPVMPFLMRHTDFHKKSPTKHSLIVKHTFLIKYKSFSSWKFSLTVRPSLAVCAKQYLRITIYLSFNPGKLSFPLRFISTLSLLPIIYLVLFLSHDTLTHSLCRSRQSPNIKQSSASHARSLSVHHLDCWKLEQQDA